MSKRKVKAPEFEITTGNVYAALGVADADEMFIKAQLMSEIAQIIKRKDLNQTKAAALLGLSQPKLSRLLCGDFHGVSERFLMDCLTKLGHDVQIVVKARSRAKEQGKVSIVFA